KQPKNPTQRQMPSWWFSYAGFGLRDGEGFCAPRGARAEGNGAPDEGGARK
ncbi:hypothetical protein PISMIDRAFT_676250, partial [Pisolithus microcarpus 441]